jgi:hypothetical protein
VYAANLYSVQIGNTQAVDNVDRSQPRTFPVPSGVTAVTVTGRHALNNPCSNSGTQNITPANGPSSPPIFKSLTIRDKDIDVRFENIQPSFQYVIQVAEPGAPNVYRSLPGFVLGNGVVETTLLNAPLAAC